MSATYHPIAALLPHRAGMLLLDRVCRFDREHIDVAATASATAWYAEDDGTMPAWIGIELMAQAVAAWVGLCALESGVPVKPGVLLGCRDYRSEQAAFAAGSVLRIVARPAYRDESGMGSFECEIRLHQQVVVAATINVYEPEDFAVFLEQRRTVQ